METEKSHSEKLVETAGDLVETYRSLIAINLAEHTSRGASLSLAGVIYMVLIIFCLLFGGIGVAWWMGEVLHSIKGGFFVVSGAYALIGVLLFTFARRKIVAVIRNIIIRVIYDND